MSTKNVEFVKSWIRKFITKTATINKRYSSYSLKHAVERWSGQYIANDDFIEASRLLGYKISKHSPNPWFNMSFVKAQKENDSRLLG